jgi:peptide/nickel transport system permease protein
MAYLPLIAVVVSAITFFTLRLPYSSDPVILQCGMECSKAQEERIRESYGLDQPAVEQYFRWLGKVATGDFGRTFRGQQPVGHELWIRLPATLELMGLSVVFTAIFGIAFGVLAAARQDSILDYVARVFAVLGQAVPEFFLLVLLIVLPSLWWNYSPPVGGHVSLLDDPVANLRLYVPPTLVVAIGGSAVLMRITRSSMLEVLRQDYVRTARAKGLPIRAVIGRHSLRNALIPIVTVIGSYIVALFFGAVVIERVFSINGLGMFLIESGLTFDFPVLQFLVLYTAFVVIVINLLVDLSYAVIDPRVKYT